MIPKEEALHLLRDYLAKVEQIRAYADQCGKMLGTSPESPLNNHLHLLIGPMGTCLERLVTGKADGGWLDWYIWDNGSGSKGMEAGMAGKIRPIRSVEDLYWVMVEA